MASLQSLLEIGYFARELPPPFNSKSFAQFALANGAGWPKGKWTRPLAHNLARPGGLRRTLELPNPVSYYWLADVLSGNWQQIRNHTWKVRFSASRPHLMKALLARSCRVTSLEREHA
jgi:hypothetical protein